MSIVVINPFIIFSSYLIQGTKAPVHGSDGGTYPPSGWTGLLNSSVDDSNYQVPSMNFTFTFNNTGRTSFFIGTNSYITFGSGSNEYNNLAAGVPALDKVFFGAADNSGQRISYVNNTNSTRFRYEGTASTSGTVGSPNIVVEGTLFNPSITNGDNVIELLVGSHSRTAGQFGPASSTTYFSNQTGNLSANQSYVFVGNSAGTSWTFYNGYYVSLDY